MNLFVKRVILLHTNGRLLCAACGVYTRFLSLYYYSTLEAFRILFELIYPALDIYLLHDTCLLQNEIIFRILNIDSQMFQIFKNNVAFIIFILFKLIYAIYIQKLILLFNTAPFAVRIYTIFTLYAIA